MRMIHKAKHTNKHAKSAAALWAIVCSSVALPSYVKQEISNMQPQQTIHGVIEMWAQKTWEPSEGAEPEQKVSKHMIHKKQN